MKGLFFLLLIASLYQACQYTEVEGYEGGSSVYFSISKDSMSYSWGTIDGDITEQVLRLPIYLFGQVKNYDRTLKIRTVLCEIDSVRAEINIDFRPVPTEVVLPADTNRTNLEITLLRTAALTKHDRVFKVVIEEDDQFDSEYNWRKDDEGMPYFIGHSMTIIMNENFTRPWWWREVDANFGVWSATKADLICRLCDVSREEFIGSDVIPEFRMKFYGKKVQEYLNEQNVLGKPVMDEDGTRMTMGVNAQQ